MEPRDRIETIQQLLQSEGVQLTPAFEIRATLQDWLALDRLTLLAELKALGLGLATRQSVANALAKAKREGRLAEPELLVEAVPEKRPPNLSIVRNLSKPFESLPPCTEVALNSSQSCRVFIISDIHCDNPSNMAWLKANLPARTADAFDVCICAGDVSDKDEVLSEALQVLRARFDEVLFTVGNHDVWISTGRGGDAAPGERTSIDKISDVQAICDRIGVRTSPVWISSSRHRDVVIVPLLSWWETFPSPFHDDHLRRALLLSLMRLHDHFLRAALPTLTSRQVSRGVGPGARARG